MAGAKRRSGGARAKSGRPRGASRPKPEAAPSLPWAAIREYAGSGAAEAEIVRALELGQALQHPATLVRFREEIAVGHARYKLELRTTIHKRGKRTARNAGSVNALALQARNVLDWDKQVPGQETEPDLGTARERLKDLLVKLAHSRSDIEGRPVTPLELLSREAHGQQPPGGA